MLALIKLFGYALLFAPLGIGVESAGTRAYASEGKTLRQSRFEQLTHSVLSRFEPWQKALGIRVEAFFTGDPGLNAEASAPDLPGDPWRISLDSGFTRGFSEDAVTMMVCHEMGHILGGFPYGDYGAGPLMTSTEAQADYWAAQTCLKEIWGAQGERLRAAIIGKINPKRVGEAKKRCQESLKQADEIALCTRIAVAGYELLEGLRAAGALSNAYSPEALPADGLGYSLESRSMAVATSLMKWGYPSPQCRLDTFFAGAICGKKAPLPALELGEAFFNRGPESLPSASCTDPGSDPNGVRPTCWFPAGSVK